MPGKTAPSSSNRFVVDLGALALNDDDRKRMASAIHGTVLSFLATNSKLTAQSKVNLIPELGTLGMIIEPSEPGAAASGGAKR